MSRAFNAFCDSMTSHCIRLRLLRGPLDSPVVTPWGYAVWMHLGVFINGREATLFAALMADERYAENAKAIRAAIRTGSVESLMPPPSEGETK